MKQDTNSVDEMARLRGENRELRSELKKLADQLSLLTVAQGARGIAPSPRRHLMDDDELLPAPKSMGRDVGRHFNGAPPATDPYARSPGPPLPAEAPAAPRVQHSLDGIDFGTISKLNEHEMDGLPFGLIVVDREGNVIHYNDTESRMVGLPAERVIGRNFFQEVAPCTRVREFEGRFRQLVSQPGLRVQSFDFVFRFAQEEQQVSIVMTPSRTRGQFNIAMVRRAIVPMM